jgi:hypothetical protein
LFVVVVVVVVVVVIIFVITIVSRLTTAALALAGTDTPRNSSNNRKFSRTIHHITIEIAFVFKQPIVDEMEAANMLAF